MGDECQLIFTIYFVGISKIYPRYYLLCPKSLLYIGCLYINYYIKIQNVVARHNKMFQMFPIPWPGNFGKLLVLAAVALDGDTGSLVVWFPPRKSPAAIGPVLYSRGGVKGVMPNPTLGCCGCLSVGGVGFLCSPPSWLAYTAPLTPVHYPPGSGSHGLVAWWGIRGERVLCEWSVGWVQVFSFPHSLSLFPRVLKFGVQGIEFIV